MEKQLETKVGKVVSTSMNKTIVVQTETYKKHPLYSKRVKYSKKYKAHDEENKAKVGDTVKLIDGNNIEYNLKIIQIAENYVSHYVYMSKEYYEANIKNYQTNKIWQN